MNEDKRLREYKRAYSKRDTEIIKNHIGFLESHIPQKEEWHRQEMQKIHREKNVLKEILAERSEGDV